MRSDEVCQACQNDGQPCSWCDSMGWVQYEDSPGKTPGRGGPSIIHKEASDKGPRGEAPGGAGSSDAGRETPAARGEARPARGTDGGQVPLEGVAP